MDTAYITSMKRLWKKIKFKFTKDWTNPDANILNLREEVYKDVVDKVFTQDQVGLYIVPSKMMPGSIYFIEFDINRNKSL